MKHVTRAIIKACEENDMNKKAASLRPFMKDEAPSSPKQDKLREAFLDIPAAKRAKKEKGGRRLTKDNVAVKWGDWTNEEDVVILDHAAKFDGKDVDWSALSLSDRVSTQCENRYKVLSRKKGNWTKEEDDAIMKYGQELGKDNDWTTLVLPGRVARQCSNRYKRLTNGKGSWTKEEDDAIMKHGEETGDTSWSTLALPNRNPKQCSKRYNYLTSKQKVSLKKGKWTTEEDQQIIEHGTTVGDKDWTVLALPGRVAKQCKNRYQRLSNKDKPGSKKQEERKKGDWTAKEDEKIKLHVENVGEKDWWIVAKELPGRGPKQCNNRYNRLSKMADRKAVEGADQKKKRKEWTIDEDQIIKDHVAKFGPGKWKVVAEQLPDRVPGGCKKRWGKYLSKEAETSKDSESFELV